MWKVNRDEVERKKKEENNTSLPSQKSRSLRVPSRKKKTGRGFRV